MKISAPTLPSAFIWRRLHSLTGLWLTGFLIIHLFTNSQAALLIGDDGSGFIKTANDIRQLPFLPVIEIALLAVPFFIHTVWGIKYLFTGESNSIPTDGTKPALNEYYRNKAYTWQRVTSWILLVLITLHVIHMRFMEYPTQLKRGPEKIYMVRVNSDPGIHSVAERLGVTLYNAQQIETERKTLNSHQSHQQQEWINALTARPIDEKQLIAVSNNFGTAELLMVRETFKEPILMLLYTVLVLSACFHGFNGLWTFLITWGITLSPRSQNGMRKVAYGLMGIIAFLGLAAVWGTFWINLRQ